MVKALHRAGIEVILDVVYNHTAKGDENGPTICFRGIDNATYYRLRTDGSGRCEDYTGTGNSLDTTHSRVLQMVMDSLRYWILEMHVDGFRFDLATTLARGPRGEFAASPFLAAIAQDPVISTAKLIAEPWDLGEGGYRVGNFPVNWKEWNGRYRDGVRDFWRGASYSMGEFASRVTGSSDLYRAGGREPLASINFVTSHDGFTLADLVSYNEKHNEANGEDNRDGDNHNRSWNCGVEGPTEDPAIRALREQQKRNFLATLVLSQGVPMILAGDELGRSQRGNNNAYCQDNPISWIDWQNADAALIDFTRRLIQLRREHPIFRRRGWFTGSPGEGRPADGSRMVSARRCRDDRGRLGRGVCENARRILERRRDDGARSHRRSNCRRQLLSDVQFVSRADGIQAAAETVGAKVDDRARHCGCGRAAARAAVLIRRAGSPRGAHDGRAQARDVNRDVAIRSLNRGVSHGLYCTTVHLFGARRNSI